MNSNDLTKGIIKAFLFIVGCIVIYKTLSLIYIIFIYFAVAAVISLWGRPILLFLQKRLKFSNTFATITTMLVLVMILFGLILLFVPILSEQSKNISLLNIEALEANATQLLNEVNAYARLYGVDLNDWIKKTFSKIDYTILPNTLNGIVNILGSFTIGLFSVLFIAFFLLKDNTLLERIILTFFSDKHSSRISRSFERIKNLLSRYFVGLVFQITILLVFYSIVLLIFGVSNAIIIAFICALFNLIPYLGPIIGGLLISFFTMTHNLDLDFASEILPKTIFVFFGFVIGQLIDNFLSQPLIFSNRVKSHPLEIFVIIIVGGLLAGPIGMIIAVPTYTALKVVLKEFLNENKIVKALTKDI